jgi:hypothetical protein
LSAEKSCRETGASGNGDRLSQPKRGVVAQAYLAAMDIEMRHLRALLALAEELNFTTRPSGCT